jgi:hypothetical protein
VRTPGPAAGRQAEPVALSQAPTRAASVHSIGPRPPLDPKLQELLKELLRDLPYVRDGGDPSQMNFGLVMAFLKILGELARPDAGVKRRG